MSEFKNFLQNMEGLERFSWYILKPIAIVLTIITITIL